MNILDSLVSCASPFRWRGLSLSCQGKLKFQFFYFVNPCSVGDNCTRIFKNTYFKNGAQKLGHIILFWCFKYILGAFIAILSLLSLLGVILLTIGIIFCAYKFMSCNFCKEIYRRRRSPRPYQKSVSRPMINLTASSHYKKSRSRRSSHSHHSSVHSRTSAHSRSLASGRIKRTQSLLEARSTSYTKSSRSHHSRRSSRSRLKHKK